jgi:hypothetical protein
MIWEWRPERVRRWIGLARLQGLKPSFWSDLDGGSKAPFFRV